jgi:predicted TIM-barrel fold metal-dependent hydrolase
MKTNGRKKVLFGSNYPMIQPGKRLENLAALELDNETRDLFLYGNTVRVFKLDGVGE